jgi:hypothetical protein
MLERYIAKTSTVNLLSFLTENETGRDRGCDVTDRSSSFRTFPIIHNRGRPSILLFLIDRTRTSLTKLVMNQNR